MKAVARAERSPTPNTCEADTTKKRSLEAPPSRCTPTIRMFAHTFPRPIRQG